MSRFFHDVRYAARRLIATPSFTLPTIIILALGMGANSALFAVLNSAVLRPLPYPNPDRLIALWEDFSVIGRSKTRVSPATFVDWQKRAGAFQAMGAYGIRSKDFSEGGPPEEVFGLGVSASLLPMLGVEPYLGRIILGEEDAPGVNVVVLSHRLWLVGIDVACVGPTNELHRVQQKHPGLSGLLTRSIHSLARRSISSLASNDGVKIGSFTVTQMDTCCGYQPIGPALRLKIRSLWFQADDRISAPPI